MGTSSSLATSDGRNSLPKFSAKDLLNKTKKGWFIAGSGKSIDILTKPGRIWGYCRDLPPEKDPTFHCAVKENPEMVIPQDGSYGNEVIMTKRIATLAQRFAPKDRLASDDNTHDDVSALAGMVLFCDYDFKTDDTEERIAKTFDLKDQREICGFAFLPAPLSYYPIGRNYQVSSGTKYPYLVFAVPEDIIINVKVDGKNTDFMNNPVNTQNNQQKCFLTAKISNITDISKCRKIPILFTVRQSKALKWESSQYYKGCIKFYKECLNTFADLLKSLTPGKHSLDVSIQFTYKMEKFGMLDFVSTVTEETGKWENRFILDEVKIVDSSNLLVKPNKPDMCTSASISQGSMDIIVPEENDFTQCMDNFFGFGKYNIGDDDDDVDW